MTTDRTLLFSVGGETLLEKEHDASEDYPTSSMVFTTQANPNGSIRVLSLLFEDEHVYMPMDAKRVRTLINMLQRFEERMEDVEAKVS